MSLYRAAAVKVRVGADRSVSEWVDDRARRPSCSSSRRMHAAQDPVVARDGAAFRRCSGPIQPGLHGGAGPTRLSRPSLLIPRP
jgi:hypothetical protein